MSDNVMVCCRFRPRNQTELSMRDEDVIECPDNRTVYISTAALAEEKRSAAMKAVFAFDYVFKPGSSQEEVFEHTARDFSDEVMKGFNCTIFAYGQTGSGKTFTMMGVPGNEGIIPRLASSIFDYIDQADEQIQFTVKISYVEIYMEHIKDLLEPTQTNLKIREGARGVWIQDVTERYVSSIDEILEIMAIGSENRAVASTNMNDESSRSHSVFMLTVGQINKQNGSKTGSKMILVDLAGSETVAKTGASGNTLKEAQHINKSLSALGNVINALTSNSPHVPYRDSKLTRLLSDSLGGNSKTCLIVTASPSIYNLDETLSTLRFGTRAKKIKNKPTVNSEKSVAEYKALLEAAIAKCTEQEELIQKLQRQIVRLKSIIREMGGRIPEDLEELASKSNKKNMARHDDDEDFDAPDDTEPALPTKAQQQQAVLLTLELQEQLKEKEEAVKSMQEDLDDRDLQLDQLQKELEAKTVELNRLRGAKGGAVSDAEAEGKFRAQTDALENAKKRIESLEKEQVVYIQQIDRLHADNLELAHLQQLHLSASNQVQATQAAGSAAGNSLAPPSERRKKSEVDGDKRKKRGSAVSGQGESDSDSDDAMDKPPAVSLLGAGAEDTIRTLKTNYDVLMAALGRKCEQYIALQMQVQKQTEKMNDMEKKLQAKPDRTETGADPAVVAKLNSQVADMQKRLEASEALCKKLFESGLYWQKRGQRKDKELKDIKRQLSDRSINIGISSAQSEAGDIPPSISDLRVQTYFEGGAERETSVQFNNTVSYAPQTTRAVSEFPRPPSPQSPRSVREPTTPGGRPMSGFLSGSMRARAPSMAAKVVVPHPIYGGGKGSAKTGAAASVARPPLTTQTFHQDAMDQFF